LGKDCSVNGNQGTAEGTGTIAAVTGYKGGGALFGGFNNPAAIHVPNSPSLQVPVSAATGFLGDFSVAFAVKLTGHDGIDTLGNYSLDNGVFSIVAKSHEFNGMSIYVDSDIEIGAAFGGAYVPRTMLSNYGILQKWVHFTYVFSNSKHNVKLYANGNLILTRTYSQNFGTMNTQDLYLGRYSEYLYPLNGTLDEVRLYNRSLTTDEIMELYNQGGFVGGVAKHLGSHTVTCKNITTGQTVKIAATRETVYNCEAKGLIVNPGDKITTIVDEKAE
jgi:hypothetical protein